MNAFQKIRPKVQLLRSKWLWAAVVCGLGIGSTFISYQPYRLAWDDSDSVLRSLTVSKDLWAGQWLGVLGATVSIHPPAMSLLGLPWGPNASWDAVGKYFVSLALLISLAACFSLYLLFRCGVKPIFLIGATFCVASALGPFPSRPSLHGPYPPGAQAHWCATALLADSLLAWTVFAFVLLVPFEARTTATSRRSPRWRGALWGAIAWLGIITKLDFLYFVFLIVPALYLVRYRKWGREDARKALGTFAWVLTPLALYFLVLDWPALSLLLGSSFGKNTNYYSISLLDFFKVTAGETPGLLLWSVGITAALIYLGSRRWRSVPKTNLYAIAVVMVFILIVLLSKNRETRYMYPAIVSLPFLLAIMLSDGADAVSAKSAAVISGVLFGGLTVASLPMLHRPVRDVLTRSDAILELANQCHARSILLATDSPTLDLQLLRLDVGLSSRQATVGTNTLAYRAEDGTPLSSDFQDIKKSDLVVFQDRAALEPPFTNERVPDYRQYLHQSGYSPTRFGPDLSVYLLRCTVRPGAAQTLRTAAQKSDEETR